MNINQVNMQLIQQNINPVHSDLHAIAALQTELATLQAKVATYYQNEIVLRGDRVMMREYCGHFGIAPAAANS